MAEWYEKSFGSDYLLVYKHRDLQGAYNEVRSMMEWLELPEGSEVLDLCCGMGRHSLVLTDFGFKVTGVDLSEALLAEARRKDAAGEVRWVRGDMREVPLADTFDAVVNLFTSFGYFEDDAENVRVLHEIKRLLKPGGSFIIDYLNPPYVKAHLVPESERTDGSVLIREQRRIENGFVKKQIVLSEGGAERTYEERVKLYDRERFEALLKEAGLAADRLYGGYDASPYEPEASPRMIFVGRKGE